MRARRYDLLALLVPLLLVPFLALYGNSRPFWYDEVHSIFYARLDLRTAVEFLKHDTHSPTFFLILGAWIKAAGDNEFSLRILPALFYMLSIVAIYLLSHSQYDRRTGLAAAFLMMTSPLLVMQAHFLRCYTILCFLAVCSLGIFLTIFCQGRSSPLLIILLSGVNALGFLTHLWFSFLILAECICSIVIFKKWALALAVLLVSVVPYCLLWLPNLIQQLAYRPKGQAWLGPPTPFDVMVTLIFFGGAFWLMLIPLLITTARIRWRTKWLKDPVLIIFALTILVPFTLSQVKYVYGYRYTIPALPAFVLIAARIFNTLAQRTAILAIVCVLLLLSSSWILIAWDRNASTDGCNDRAMAQFLVQNAEPTDIIIYVGLQRLPIQYYLDRLGSHLEGFSLPRGIDQHPDYLNNYVFRDDREHLANDARVLFSTLRSRLWVVYGWNNEMNEEIEGIMAEQFDASYVKDFECRQVSDFGSVYFTKVISYIPKQGPYPLDKRTATLKGPLSP